MVQKLLVCATLIAISSPVFAGDPATEVFKKKFDNREQILLAGVLTDPQQASEFAKDANEGGSDVARSKWFGRLSAFSQDYVSRKHDYDDKTAIEQKEAKHFVEKAEWNMLMVALRKMKTEGGFQQVKLQIFIGMLESANKDLQNKETASGHKVVDLGRENLTEGMNKYLASANGKNGLAEAERQRREKAERDQLVAQAPPPSPRLQETAAPLTKPLPTKTDKKPNQGALQQAEKAKEEAEGAAAARVGGGSAAYDNTDKPLGSSAPPPVRADGQSSGKFQRSLPPSAGNLTAGSPSRLAEPPSPDSNDDMAELHAMKKSASGNNALFATIGAGLLGGLLGFFLGGMLGIPLIGAIVGAAALGYAGHKVGKLLWG